MRFLLFLNVLLTILLFSCKKEKTCIARDEPKGSCSFVNWPVCGCDGVTYGNSCIAESYGIDDYVDGECK